MDAKTELARKIHEDIQSEIMKYYNRVGITYRADENAPEKTIIDFFSYLYKRIPVLKRRVEYSNELQAKIDRGELSEKEIEVLKKYKNAFEKGMDMNAFLSNQTSAPGKVDFLRYTWHLYHLHLSENLNVNNKNNRSNKQLLCIINDDCTYFVDMISHPEKAENYFKLLYLKIIQRNNWMEHIGYLEIPGMVPGSQAFKVTSEEDIFELYSKGPINIFLEVENKGYISLDSITSTRNPQRSTKQMRIINRNIRKLKDRADDYKGFKFETDKAGLLMGMVEFENSKQGALRIDILKEMMLNLLRNHLQIMILRINLIQLPLLKNWIV